MQAMRTVGLMWKIREIPPGGDRPQPSQNVNSTDLVGRSRSSSLDDPRIKSQFERNLFTVAMIHSPVRRAYSLPGLTLSTSLEIRTGYSVPIALRLKPRVRYF